MKKIIVGNWKMNPGSLADAKKIFAGISGKAGKFKKVETIICPPYPFLPILGTKKGMVKMGSQDVFYEEEGAFTGSVSPLMVKSVGAHYAIIGHSERRKAGDTNEIVNRKIKSAIKNGLTVIFCVGEADHDEAGLYLKELQKQIEAGLAGLKKVASGQIIVAHEPIWAIGALAKGADSPESFQHNRLFIKKILAGIFGKKNGLEIPILYGGSANVKNASDFLTVGEADGLLVGRASLSPEDFLKIVSIANDI